MVVPKKIELPGPGGMQESGLVERACRIKWGTGLSPRSLRPPGEARMLRRDYSSLSKPSPENSSWPVSASQLRADCVFCR